MHHLFHLFYLMGSSQLDCDILFLKYEIENRLRAVYIQLHGLRSKVSEWMDWMDGYHLDCYDY